MAATALLDSWTDLGLGLRMQVESGSQEEVAHRRMRTAGRGRWVVQFGRAGELYARFGREGERLV